MTQHLTLSAPPLPELSPSVQQQMELLQRTIDEHARAVAAVAHARAATSTQSTLSEADVVAQLRRARLEIRAQTGHVLALVERTANRTG